MKKPSPEDYMEMLEMGAVPPEQVDDFEVLEEGMMQRATARYEGLKSKIAGNTGAAGHRVAAAWNSLTGDSEKAKLHNKAADETDYNIGSKASIESSHKEELAALVNKMFDKVEKEVDDTFNDYVKLKMTDRESLDNILENILETIQDRTEKLSKYCHNKSSKLEKELEGEKDKISKTSQEYLARGNDRVLKAGQRASTSAANRHRALKDKRARGNYAPSDISSSDESTKRSTSSSSAPSKKEPTSME